MLKNQYDGSVMKAAVKPMCGSREIKFYEQLQLNTTDPNMEMLKKLVPEYRGTVKMPFRGKMVMIYTPQPPFHLPIFRERTQFNVNHFC